MNAKTLAGYERLPLLEPAILSPEQQEIYA